MLSPASTSAAAYCQTVRLAERRAKAPPAGFEPALRVKRHAAQPSQRRDWAADGCRGYGSVRGGENGQLRSMLGVCAETRKSAIAEFTHSDSLRPNVPWMPPTSVSMRILR